MATNGKAKKKIQRTLDARPDTLDFRDQMYVATLVEVPPQISLSKYKSLKVPILDQGTEGACTGFGLATVANYLLRHRRVSPGNAQVSPRMLYEMARRYDEWPGEAYEGSSARGAMKGWHKHGVCSEKIWPYQASDRGELSALRAKDATRRPLGAYFRVNHKDLVGMHAALAEVGVLYATAVVHDGWDRVGKNGKIAFSDKVLGGHAFAIVAYDQRGFWLQNSWGKSWGAQGFGHLTYDDWLQNGTDIWVARLGVPVTITSAGGVALTHSGQHRTSAYTFEELRPHIVSVGNDGLPRNEGTYATTTARISAIFADDFPRITKSWKKKRLLLYAHGGLTDEESAVQRVADFRTSLLEAEIYPVSFIWKTDYWTTLKNVLEDALHRRRPEGRLIDAAKDFMLDRLDDALEILARRLTGKLEWDEMKENALLATTGLGGAARLVAQEVAKLNSVELHLVGHSAGSILHAPLAQLLATPGKIASGPMKGEQGHGLKIASCTMWAPACTVSLFNDTYRPLIGGGQLQRFALFGLTDQAEQDDDCAGIYHKSLLYLVSNAFEQFERLPFGSSQGEPILGMQRFIDSGLRKLLKQAPHQWVLAPNAEPVGSVAASGSRSHGGFDDDRATLRATLAFILNKAVSHNGTHLDHTLSGLRSIRGRINDALVSLR